MMKDKIKNFFANKYVQAIIAYIASLYINFVKITSKYIVKGNYEEISQYIKHNKGLVLMTWHGRIFFAPVELNRMFKNSIKNKRKINVLASPHRDGRIASKVMKRFNIEVIEGSTIDPKKGSKKNKKSFTSLRAILKSLNEGNICVLAADAPRGPVYQMNTKIANVVQKSNSAIACVSISYKRKIIFNTWDKFHLPLPFNKAIIEYGQLIKVREDNDIEEVNKSLGIELNKLTKINDREAIL